jgi:transcriptional regulator with XRE-family HTH domain
MNDGIIDRMKQIMEMAGFSNQSDFAKKCEISPAVISHLLHGRNNISLSVAKRICDKCNVSLMWLMDGIGGMQNPMSGEQLSEDGHEEPTLFDEKRIFSHQLTSEPKNRQDLGGESPFNNQKSTVVQEIRYVEKPPRKITEIRIFFDDNTFEIFKPEK